MQDSCKVWGRAVAGSEGGRGGYPLAGASWGRQQPLILGMWILGWCRSQPGVPPEKRQKIQTMPNNLLPPVFAGDPVFIRAHGHVLDT